MTGQNSQNTENKTSYKISLTSVGILCYSSFSFSDF